MDLDKILADIESSDLSTNYKEKSFDSSDIADVFDDKSAESSSEVSQVSEEKTETHDTPEEKRLDVEVDKGLDKEPQKIDSQEFTSPGNKKWNSVPPYVLNISSDKVERDISKLSKSYFFTEKILSDTELKDEIKRALLLFLRRNINTISSGYDEFIFKSIIRNCRKISDYFDVDDQTGKLLLYHTGVLNISKILLNEFKLNKTGFCFYQDENGNTVRYLPIEYINSMVLNWFNENINILPMPFNSITEFERIKSIILKKYFSDKKEFKTRLDIVNSKIDQNKNISAEALIKLKGSEWYGNEIITVYQRFTGKSLFRT